MMFKVSKKRSGKMGVSPAVSTVIMTGAMVAILAVTLSFANNFLWTSVAQGDFDSSKQLMQTVGLQIDDVAWTVGRTETITYGTQYGEITFADSVLNYTVTVDRVGLPSYSVSKETGALMFVFPTSKYSITNGYWENIFPTQNESLTLKGTSAPVARVFAVEQLPMADGSYIRVVVAPSIRVLYSSINTSRSTYYVRVYLPVLNPGESPRLSQSITLTGESFTANTTGSVTGINISVDFPSGDAPQNFNSDFFNFPENSENIEVPIIVEPGVEGYQDVVLELYLSEVSVGFGIN